jgi:hypothetical protein
MMVARPVSTRSGRNMGSCRTGEESDDEICSNAR